MSRRGDGYESGTMSASEMAANFPEVLKRPGAGVVVPEPQDAPPRVPLLACPKCGEPETTMRWCGGGYSIGWGMCFAASPPDHFHRECTNRCHYKWVTYDTLDGAS